MGSPLLNIRALCYLTLALTAVPAVGSENTLMPEVDVGLKLILNYSEIRTMIPAEVPWKNAPK